MADDTVTLRIEGEGEDDTDEVTLPTDMLDLMREADESNAEIVGKTPTEAVGDEIGSEIESRYRECVERREAIRYPEEIPVDGEKRQWETKLTPVITEGRVDKLVGAMRDVTGV